MAKRGRPPHDDVLTPAEWRMVEMIRHGMTGPQIARRAGVSTEAVKFHVANILAKLDLPNRIALRHWPGIRRDSALNAKEQNMGDANALLGPVGQISRHVKDIAAARHFFGETLGLPHLYSFGDLAFFDCGGVRLFLSQTEAGSDSESILYFRVEDIRLVHIALASQGVEFVDAPHLIHRHEDGIEEWMSFFKDNEGRLLALMEQVKPAG
ncbi:MAG TPA: LuxR C-terminal-related transcriptional regulator [Allosphingosinicella sp.]|nr:LuxR C-terminal-related transcriptional regulator [Allosphingosinicella sp.]